jgi:hypothetical protein
MKKAATALHAKHRPNCAGVTGSPRIRRVIATCWPISGTAYIHVCVFSGNTDISKVGITGTNINSER